MNKKEETNAVVLDRDISKPEARLKRKKPPPKKKANDNNTTVNKSTNDITERTSKNDKTTENNKQNNNIDSNNKVKNEDNIKTERTNKSIGSREHSVDIKSSERNSNLESHDVSMLQEDNKNQVSKDVQKIKKVPKMTENSSKATPRDSKFKCHRCEQLQKELDEYKKNLEDLQDEFSRSKELNEEIERLNKDIELRNKNINLLSDTNKKQHFALEKLSKELDDKIEKLKLIQIQKKNNIPEEEKKRKEAEEKLKLKEGELKNSLSLIQILSRDNKKLKELLDTYGEYKKKMELVDLSHFKDEEQSKLSGELAILKKQLEDHKKCVKKIQDQNNNIRFLKGEIKRLKNENADLKKKLNILNGPPSLSIEKPQHNLLAKNYNNDSTSYYYDKESYNNKYNRDNYHNDPYKNYNQSSYNKYNNISYNKYNNDSSYIEEAKNKRNKSVIHYRSNSSEMPKLKSKSTESIKDKKKKEEVYNSLFTPQEKEAIEKLFYNDKEKFDVFIRKVNILEGARVSLTVKHKLEIKKLMEKVDDLTEQIEYLNLKNKESESRIKILQCQVNEYKNEQKTYQKKLNEMQSKNNNK